jgi:hypothetical protein
MIIVFKLTKIRAQPTGKFFAQQIKMRWADKAQLHGLFF